MRVLLISHGDFDYDGRLRELFTIFSEIGDLYAFTQGSLPRSGTHQIYHNSGYLGFIRSAVTYGKGIKDVDLLVLDNRKAVIPGAFLCRAIHPRAVIQDCRELYIQSESKRFTTKIGCFFERYGISRADIVICANQERAKIMKELYHLDAPPLVYENLRRLQYSSAAARDMQVERFSKYLHDDEFRILSTFGCNVSRTNDVLVRELKKVKEKCRLFLVGASSKRDMQIIRGIIAEEELENVEILDRLDQDALKYLISVCHIGVVNYSQVDTNNKFCASGKLYEFVYEGLPVITTTNPPLKRLCDAFHIGVSDDRYSDGINKLIAHYPEYCQNVQKFAADYTVERNNANLLRQLRERLDAFL